MPIKTYREAINEALAQEMRRDPTVIIIGEDVAGGAGCEGERDASEGVRLGAHSAGIGTVVHDFSQLDLTQTLVGSAHKPRMCRLAGGRLPLVVWGLKQALLCGVDRPVGGSV